jgi:hypothetical protein
MNSPHPARPGSARVRAAAVTGVDGYAVEVTADTAAGGPQFSIRGLPGAADRETRDRVRAAVIFPVKSAC